MKRFSMRILRLMAAGAVVAGEAPPPTVDSRTDLGLTAEERAAFLAEMRVVPAGIQGILRGIGAGDRERIAEAARGPFRVALAERALRSLGRTSTLLGPSGSTGQGPVCRRKQTSVPTACQARGILAEAIECPKPDAFGPSALASCGLPPSRA